MSYEPLGKEPVVLSVAPADSGVRLDAYLARYFTEYSRVLLRRAISAGGVTIDGRNAKPAYRLLPGQKIEIVLPDLPRQTPQAEDIPIEILFEDEHIAVINKPPGMVVHPARGHWSGTLAGAIQFHLGAALSTTGGPSRPGIVHRLDRDTSGAILVARNDMAHLRLARQFHNRTIEKEYFAITSGAPNLDRDIIDCPIGFHPHDRERMAIRLDDGSSRSAQTFYEVAERFDGFAAVKVMPKTGRTHQIRVHLNHIGCPVLCDRQYGHRAQITRGELRRDSSDALVLLDRQALHARRLKFEHPVSGERMEIEAPLPADLLGVLEALRTYRPGRTRSR